jgi:hypothetical protein
MHLKTGITVTATAFALVVGGVSFAAEGPSNAGQPLVINALSRATAINNFVDTGPPGWSSPGDLYVWVDRLFAAEAPTAQIGSVDGVCVLVDPAALRLDCSYTAKLRDGAIVASGSLSLVEGGTSTAAIVGGTGAYQTARGEVSVELGPFMGPHEVTINLILQP